MATSCSTFLTKNLRSLERDGYLTREVDPGPPIAVRYTLTDIGEELLPLLKALTVWAASRHSDIARSRKAFDEAK
ncbi:winged helix-turn-helix transcriptional regulator [Roseobacter sp. CCS2]|uniref:winged helix-turn-helix transcriptional regulator n=1 Tax=Roseobacter sp. CCS2 TaxID=391593 RepID=UPI002FBE338F